MRVFLQWLARQLDSERKNWRSNTVIQLDGASYHLSQETKGTLEQLGMSAIYSGPQSYDCAPTELLFAIIKRQDINPLELSFTKK